MDTPHIDAQIALSTLQVEVIDQFSGKVTAARVYMQDEGGKQWALRESITYDKGDEHHFISTGSFKIQLPPEKYTLAVERGTEYRPTVSSTSVQAGRDIKRRVVLRRWIRMNELGWFSGDLHNHRSPSEMPSLLLAEDLNLAPTVTDWIWKDRGVSLPPQTADAIRQVDATHVYSVLDKEVERLERGPGATLKPYLSSVWRARLSRFHRCSFLHRLAGPRDRFLRETTGIQNISAP